MLCRNLLNFPILLTILLILTCSNIVLSCVKPCYPFKYAHLYSGISLNYAHTTWSELSSDDLVVEVSTPVSAKDYGISWGAFIGYQIDSRLALEATYTRYPNTIVTLNDFSFYYPLTEFTTKTQAWSLIGKFLLPLINSRVNAYLDAGVGLIHRNDILITATRVTPTFGLGLIANASRNIIVSLGVEYYVGYGKSERLPIKDYIPFLFSAYFKIGYRIL